MISSNKIQIISAPSILGLKPSGVEKLAASLLSCGLFEKLNCTMPVISVPLLNDLYSYDRDGKTHCLNVKPLRDFSITLGHTISAVTEDVHFPLVLGGDCSILIGILSTLKQKGNFGLIFCDAHADFYQPEQSTTGETADMDLAIVTGRGPDILSNIHNQKPYVAEDRVIHIGQRDWEETQKYGSQDIRESGIRRVDYEAIQENGINESIRTVLQYMDQIDSEDFWIHFDTDVLSDEENPCVDYRIPGGLSFDDYEQLLRTLLESNKIVGLSVTIFNPAMDDAKQAVTNKLTQLIGRSFRA